MTPASKPANEKLTDNWDRVRIEREKRTAAARRSEAMLRILKDRSTVVDEAVRMNVDVDTVVDWLSTTLAAISRALDSDSAATRRVSSDPRVTQRQIVTA
jgi:hypothetical protein